VTIAGETDSGNRHGSGFKGIERDPGSRNYPAYGSPFLNYEVAELKDQIPTCENVARVIWNLLNRKFRKGVCIAYGSMSPRTFLPIVTVTEQAQRGLRNAESLHVELGRRYHFAASHRLHSAQLSEAENCRIYGSATIHTVTATTTRWKFVFREKSIRPPG